MYVHFIYIYKTTRMRLYIQPSDQRLPHREESRGPPIGGDRFQLFLRHVVVRQQRLLRKATPPGAAHLAGQLAQGLGRRVEAGVAGRRVSGPHANPVALIVAILVEGPAAAPRNHHRLGPVVVVQLGHVVVQELLAPDEKVIEVEVQHVVLPSVGRAGKPETGRHVVKSGRHVGAVVVPVGPPVGGPHIHFVVILVRVDNPDAGEAAGRDSIVKVVVVQRRHVVDGSKALAALVVVVKAVQVLDGR